MTTGTFDPSSFMHSNFTESNDTKFEPIPPGEYAAQVEGSTLEVKEWKSKDGEKNGLKLAMRILLDDANLREKLGREKVTVRHEVMLDLTPSGGLDFGKGKNIKLGQLRQATGLNTPGQPFSFPMFEGRSLKVKIGQRTNEGEIYDEVKGVAPL